MPLFFDPVKRGGTTYVDGGILNPLPLNICKDMPGDVVVAVNVSGTSYQNENQNENQNDNDNENENENENKTKTKTTSLLTGKGRGKTQAALDFLSSLLPDEPEVNYFTMSQRLFRLMIQKNAALNIQLYKPDILVDIPMELFGPFEYDHVDKISAYGREKMREALNEVKSEK